MANIQDGSAMDNRPILAPIHRNENEAGKNFSMAST